VHYGRREKERTRSSGVFRQNIFSHRNERVDDRHGELPAVVDTMRLQRAKLNGEEGAAAARESERSGRTAKNNRNTPNNKTAFDSNQ